MKKLSLFLFLSASIFLTSCEKDSNDDQSNNKTTSEEAILGNWELTDYKVEEGETVTKITGGAVTQKYSSVGKDFDMEVIFNNEPTHTVTSNGSFISETKITVLGQTQVTEIPLYTLFESSEWKIKDGNLIFIDEDSKETKMNTLESTDKKLVLSYELNEVLEVQGGATATTTGKLTITLERDSSDNNSNTSTPSLIIGDWNLTELTSEDEVLSLPDVNEEIKFEGIASDLNGTLTFTDNPKEIKTEGNFHYKITYEDEEEPFEEDRELDFFNFASGWKLENNDTELYDHRDGSLEVSSAAEILELTETTLKLEIPYTKDYGINDLSEIEKITFYATFTKK
ncbi:lipocalin-like protein [Maribacter vaceletii]|uniref:Lipocalin-like protein n=1 Tax=Maribacter vaceletii TaxID=1206816 RepID=A0A495DUB0_9FLAO|nr:lipocalin family protein [Maribacter vaceletii]RKR07749.1 lipocalin-like protein [Maribacter vaceletii]